MSNSQTNPIAYVRDRMMPEQEPPALESGAVRWVRENLFSSPLNVILTVIGIASVVLVVLGAGPWLLHSVWKANSLAECREIIEATWGPDAHGACWALIRERWPQYLFGFYPSEMYWRPVLSFVLMFVALAPVLFPRLPSQMLLFSLIYPLLAFWLLWGGSIWVPVTVLAGFVIGYFAFVTLQPAAGAIVATIAAAVLPIIWWVALAGPVASLIQGILPLGIEEARSDKFGGFMLSLTIGVSGIVISLPLGILLALGRRSDMVLVKTICVGFIEFIRGVPLITLLFTASLLLNYFLPPGTNFDVIVRVIIMVTLFSAAYIAEVVRGGLAALPRGQYEAADALGLDYWQAQRFIILPQALKISIPGIVSSFIGLFKDTTLVIFVGLLDPLKGITDAVRSSTEWNGVYWEPYIFVGILFFLICFGMSRYSMYLEQKLQREHR